MLPAASAWQARQVDRGRSWSQANDFGRSWRRRGGARRCRRHPRIADANNSGSAYSASDGHVSPLDSGIRPDRSVVDTTTNRNRYTSGLRPAHLQLTAPRPVGPLSPFRHPPPPGGARRRRSPVSDSPAAAAGSISVVAVAVLSSLRKGCRGREASHGMSKARAHSRQRAFGTKAPSSGTNAALPTRARAFVLCLRGSMSLHGAPPAPPHAPARTVRRDALPE